jgi:hypothetical protein
MPAAADPAAASASAPTTDPAVSGGADPAAAVVAPLAQAPARPGYVPEAFWDAATGAVREAEFGQHLTDLATLKEAADARTASVPAAATGYKLELPETVKLPEGAALNLKDPLFLAAQTKAHELGLTQKEFSELAGLVVQGQLQERQQLAEFRKAEREKLGTNAVARVEAVETALKGRFGDEAKHLIPLLVSSQQVALMERLLSSSTAAPFSHAGREADDPNTIPGYATMTFQQRMAALDARKAVR